MTPRTLTFGRAADACDVLVDGAGVSSEHCSIGWDAAANCYLLEDLHSSNGTFLNGQRLASGGRSPIQIGQAIGLGSRISLVFTEQHAAQLYAKATGAVAAPPRSAAPLMQPPAGAKSWVIGRGHDADIIVDAPNVSWHHARVTASGSRFIVEDLGSSNGTSLNQPGQRIQRAEAGPGDHLFLGTYRFPLARLGSVSRPSLSRSMQLPEAGRHLFIGRNAPPADIVIDEPMVSARHAEIRRNATGQLEIRDAGSANGTFVNGFRIKDWTPISETDAVALGPVSLQLSGHSVRARNFADGVTLTAQGCCVEVPTKDGIKRIVDEVSLTMLPGEFVGLMGPSGAGKTTLLQAINGYKRPSQGTVFVNGLDLYEHYDAFRQTIGYVPQEDIVYPHLTVYESLFATAKLRLPSDLSDEEIDKQIRDVLRTLEIDHVADTIIGDKEDKGISGGQRKRVNLAQELLAAPRLLFLDEPTSGLSSEDTLNVMRMLRQLADSGRTIILTLHQPSLEAYRLMDNLVLMYEGALVYYGPSYPDAIEYMNQDTAEQPHGLLDDPGHALRPLSRERELIRDGKMARETAIATRVARFKASKFHASYVRERAAAPNTTAGQRPASRPSASMVGQWATLLRRGLLLKWKDKTNTGILFAQAPIIAFAICLLLGGTRTESYLDFITGTPRVIFLLVISSLWFGCSNAARELVSERAVYQRERMVNLTIPSYLMSKVALLGALCAVQTAILIGIVWNWFHLSGTGNAFALGGILWLVSLCGLGLGLLISSLVKSGEAAVSMLPLLLIPQVLSAGSIISMEEISGAGRTAAMVTPSRWGFEAALSLIYGDDGPARMVTACHAESVLSLNEATLPANGKVGTVACLGPAAQSCSMSEASNLGCPSGESVRLPGSITPTGMDAGLKTTPGGNGMCEMGLCKMVEAVKPISPLEKAFGISDSADPLRKVRRDATATLPAPLPQRAPYAAPTSYRVDPDPTLAAKKCAGVLGAIFLALLLMVGISLRVRDPLPD
ncbi:MAG: FHA domain-containing protein [Deltaproteobacteria bacterium]|nr:FHA domain-containing protein [Deltaproteobacteria bacterium]